MLMSSLNSREGWAYDSSAQIQSKPANHGGTFTFRSNSGRPAGQLVVHVDAHEMTVTDRGQDGDFDSETDLHKATVSFARSDSKSAGPHV